MDEYIFVGRETVAELTSSLASPAPKGAVGFDCAAVGTPGGHGGPIEAWACLGGYGFVFRGAVAELTTIIVSPAPKGAVGLDSAAVGKPGGHGRPIEA